MLYIASDHRGYELKEKIKVFLDELGEKYEDLGNFKYDENDDYPDFGKLAAEKVSGNPQENCAVLICGSGVGMDIVANRHKNVRSVLAWSKEVAESSRRDDDTNVLSLGADYLDGNTALAILETWLKTEFSSEERYLRRIKKIDS